MIQFHDSILENVIPVLIKTPDKFSLAENIFVRKDVS
jgi:hypothetical protein